MMNDLCFLGQEISDFFEFEQFYYQGRVLIPNNQIGVHQIYFYFDEFDDEMSFFGRQKNYRVTLT
ncbi:hypothetical protein pb186bvf_002513 [Paramecium bursaria]